MGRAAESACSIDRLFFTNGGDFNTRSVIDESFGTRGLIVQLVLFGQEIPSVAFCMLAFHIWGFRCLK